MTEYGRSSTGDDSEDSVRVNALSLKLDFEPEPPRYQFADTYFDINVRIP